MCGICGVYQYHSQVPVPEQVLGNMLGVIHHRGPDEEGMFYDKDMAFGMRRLSIIDLSGGQQPMFNEDGSIDVVYNGEIYNYRERVEQLRQRGHVFKSESDTEVLVHLYEEYGDACVDWLRGMFGFAIWDANKRRLLIARDQLGIKPMYYTQQGDHLVFGSEIKAILQHPDVYARPNLTGLTHFISLRYVPAPLTMFDDIFALPPGHLLTCDEHGVNVRCYWDLSFAASGQDAQRSEESYIDELETRLRQSVHMQLMSDVPFGAFLSGGIDSSTTVALMSQFMTEPVKTFSVGFEGEGEEMSELPYARLVTEQYHTDHHQVCLHAHTLI